MRSPIPGCHGRAAIVDLGRGRLDFIELSEGLLRRHLGGAGLAVRLLYDLAPAGVETLSGENPVVFAAAPLIGSGLPVDSRAAVAARSPLTGFVGDSMISGSLGLAVKQLGVDALVLAGACDELSVVVVDGDRLRIEAAPSLAGRSPRESEERLLSELGPGYHAAAIGPAGEGRVRFASVAHQGRHAGRTGIGAVLGAKRVKALALRGTAGTTVADPEGVARAARDWRARAAGPATEKYRGRGTAGNLAEFDALGILPARNFQMSVFAGAPDLSERAGGSESRGSAGGAEYESLFALGPLLDVDDPGLTLQAARLCDELGLDTISAGGTLAWAMESAERGLPGGSSPPGPWPSFGDGHGAINLLRLIGARSGPGDVLAEGSRRAAAWLGQGSGAWAMHVKGLELPGYEPRALRALALALAVSPRGACHNRSSAYDADFAAGMALRDPDEIAELVAKAEDRAAVLDSLTVGKFLRRCFRDFYPEAAALVSLVTGWQVSADELRAAGSRVNGLRKAFNVREGWRPEDDTLPARLLEEPIRSGPRAGESLSREQLREMIQAYYPRRGWDARGMPVPTTEDDVDQTGIP